MLLVDLHISVDALFLAGPFDYFQRKKERGRQATLHRIFKEEPWTPLSPFYSDHEAIGIKWLNRPSPAYLIRLSTTHFTRKIP
jgi:hypothetical protein